MGMSAADIQTMIDNLDAAIANALQAQAYSIGGRSKTSAALQTLMQERKYWQTMLDRVSDGGKAVARNPIFGPSAGAASTDNGIDP